MVEGSDDAPLELPTVGCSQYLDADRQGAKDRQGIGRSPPVRWTRLRRRSP